jgi:hypothetical protein
LRPISSTPAPFDACNSRRACRDPLKGGLWIHAAEIPDGDCSSAFLAEKPNGDKVLVTAGHCITGEGGIGHAWKHGDPWNRFGEALNHSLPPGGGNALADVGWILIDSDEDVTPDIWFFESGPTDIEQLGGIAGDAQQQEEAAICRSAKTTGFRCGLIKNTQADKWVCDSDGTCWDLIDVHTMNKDAQGGDSGGLYRMSLYGPPWYYGAAGVHSHSSEPGTCDDSAGECRAWYTTVNRLENQTILTVCASGRCDDIP